eukprot:2100660-Pleurochrysis_carterae.AAC.1
MSKPSQADARKCVQSGKVATPTRARAWAQASHTHDWNARAHHTRQDSRRKGAERIAQYKRAKV